jgi:hypothetical protein
MAKGNGIIVSANPRGVFLEGLISGTPKPGTVMQISAATEPVGGRYQWEAYNPDADGNQRIIAVLLPDELQGKTAADAYVTGTRGFLYCPVPGEELNMLVKDVAGTGENFAIGDLFIVDDGTGKLVDTTGTPEAEPFICLETIAAATAIAADHLVHCMFTGY